MHTRIEEIDLQKIARALLKIVQDLYYIHMKIS